MPQLSNSYIYQWQNSFNSESVELYRKTITYSKYGEQAISEAKVVDITASIQPVINSDLIELPEGDRERVQYKMYTNYSGLMSEDIIIHIGGRHQIKQPPMAWRVLGKLHHYKVYLYKIENE